jgi:hypothetical protein
MLFDNGTAINAYDFSIGKCLLDDAHGLCVKVGLVVGGNQYGTINHQIVGISGRQSFTLNFELSLFESEQSSSGTLNFFVNGAGQRQLQ